LSQQGDQAIVAKLLSKSVCHLWPPTLQPEARIELQVDLALSSKYVCIVEETTRHVK